MLYNKPMKQPVKNPPPLPADPRLRIEILMREHEFDPFSKLLGMRVESVEEDFARVALPFRGELTQPRGTMHGGALASLADSAMAIALLASVGHEKSIVTIEMKINYLEPVAEGTAVAECRITHRGKRTAFGDIDIRVGDRLVARATGTFMLKEVASNQ